MKKNKILIMANTYWNLYNFRSGVIKKLISSGFDVLAVAHENRDSDFLKEMGCRVLPIKIYSKSINPLVEIITLVHLFFLIIYERPKVCLLYTSKPNIYGSLASTFLGCSYINNISGLGSVFISGGWIKNFIVFFYKFSLIRSHKVFFQNRDDLDFFLNLGLLKIEQSLILPGSGVDLERFKPENISNNLNTDQDFSFILIARMIKDKGVIEYVEAAKIVHKSFKNVKFKLLGPLGVDNPSAITKAEMINLVNTCKVEYLGLANDVRPFIESSTCVVLPSYREGTSRVLLEAAAMCKPIITTDVPGCKNVVEDGKTGFLCKAKSATDLAQKMIQMIELSSVERFKMGALARKKMQNEYDERLVIDMYMKEIKKIVK